jgi:hypothetical protein
VWNGIQSIQIPEPTALRSNLESKMKRKLKKGYYNQVIQPQFHTVRHTCVLIVNDIVLFFLMQLVCMFYSVEVLPQSHHLKKEGFIRKEAK